MGPSIKADKPTGQNDKNDSTPTETMRQVVHWVQSNPLETMLLFFLVVGIILFFNPLPQFNGVDKIIVLLPTTMRGNVINIVHWMAHGGGAQISGTTILVTGFFVGLWRLREQLLYTRRYWSIACPQCQKENVLKRVHRTRKDRMLNWLAVPTRRYRCRACRWEGLRIDENIV